MPQPIPSNISTILVAIRAQLAGWTPIGIDISRIRPSTIADTQHTDAPKEILLVPESERKDPKTLGAGRTELRMRRYLNVVLRTRCGLDPGNEDTQWLTNASTDPLVESLGHFAVEDAIVDSMFLFQPEDALGNALTYEPIIFMAVERPTRTHADRASDYGYSYIRFDVPYIRTLTTSTNTNLI